jgi:GAF domain-containing protein
VRCLGRKRIETFRRSANQLLEMVAHDQPEARILNFLARMVAEHRPGVGIAIALAGDPPHSFICGGALEAIVTVSEETPIPRATRERRMVCVENVRGDATRLSFGGAGATNATCAWWSTPIFSGAESVAGTVSLIFPQLCTRVPADKELLATAGRLAGVALSHRQIH